METKVRTIRLNSEKTIDHDFFKLKIGTTNKIKPNVIYVEGRTFIRPLHNKDNYNSDVVNIKRRFNDFLKTYTSNNEFFSSKFILDFQVAQSGICINKRSFLSFQFLLKQKDENHILKLKDVKNSTENAIKNILNNLIKEIEKCDFEVSKTKK
jgi:hypothetical protein